MATLHMLRDLDARLCLEALDPGAGDRLVLIQDAVLSKGPFPCEVHACQQDATARGVTSPFPAVTYDGIRDLILEHDKVVLW
jgi:sulfur transfer complex TusBCD TusB component (DsrH family)